ncbi:YraN family protein [Pseudodesulfovibrio cashew]|uniref:UPF0102 protein GM415_07250 n=1 Tax=Pseudodesulfovibrio cashew TaxID=2678688 RepID=A0A6I6JFH9_9BACT|nr:YraN family protein [Pseudodesulfovibrio cashew]QGY39929.1 YraN family protein [Pseudodesulfovibrio cashew]
MGLIARILPSRRRGEQGEEAAARFLKTRGFRVLERNWRYRQWELDLICRDRDTLVFVEVKTRAATTMGSPADGLGRRKRERLVKAASRYLSTKNLWDMPCRFDFVAVVDREGSLEVEHVENAFDLTGME